MSDSITPCTRSSGTLAPEVTNTLRTPVNHAGSSSVASSISCEGVPSLMEISVSRTEFELFLLPTTNTKSASGAMARTAVCRLVVA